MNSELKEKLNGILDNQLFGLYPKLASILQHGHVHKIIDCMAKSYNLDRTPSPSGGIRSAEEIICEVINEDLQYLDDRAEICVGSAINAIHAYHNQFAWDGWIRCEDRLPEDAGDVLVGDIEHDIVRIGFYNSSGWYIPNAPYSDVTHWQPLPSPPQNTKES